MWTAFAKEFCLQTLSMLSNRNEDYLTEIRWDRCLTTPLAIRECLSNSQLCATLVADLWAGSSLRTKHCCPLACSCFNLFKHIFPQEDFTPLLAQNRFNVLPAHVEAHRESIPILHITKFSHCIHCKVTRCLVITVQKSASWLPANISFWCGTRLIPRLAIA